MLFLWYEILENLLTYIVVGNKIKGTFHIILFVCLGLVRIIFEIQLKENPCKSYGHKIVVLKNKSNQKKIGLATKVRYATQFY